MDVEEIIKILVSVSGGRIVRFGTLKSRGSTLSEVVINVLLWTGC